MEVQQLFASKLIQVQTGLDCWVLEMDGDNTHS